MIISILTILLVIALHLFPRGIREKVMYITSRGMNISTGDPLEQATPYIKALSHLWGWGELTVVGAQNMDYSSEVEIEVRITKAIEEGLEICKTF